MSRIRRAVVFGVIAAVLLSAISAHASFPGKNGKFVFTAECCDPAASRFDGFLFTANPDGTGVQPIPDPPTVDPGLSGFAQWSPDGKRIAFSSVSEEGFRSAFQIWVIDADGGNPVRVTQFDHPPGFVDSLDPSWSPDGKRLVYQRENQGLWTVGADGSDDRVLIRSQPGRYIFPSSPVWSPRGDRIAFSAYVETYPDVRGVWTVRPDGTDLRLVSLDPDHNASVPSWSPDGEYIAFERGVGDDQIWVIRADGTGLRSVPTDPAMNTRSPVWSPDGTQIAVTCFCFGDTNEAGIGAMNVDGTNLHSIVRLSRGSAYFHDWQPIPGPKRSDFKNSNQFCKAEQAFWDNEFAGRHGGGANAFGKCVSQNH